MMYNDLDWDDIESRLYSQVYHASAEAEGFSAPTSSNINDDANNLQSRFNVNNITSKSTKQNNRYFHQEKDVYSNSPLYISLEQNKNMTIPDSTCNRIQNINICTGSSEGESSSSGNFVGQFQNNITVNQYSIPLIINTEPLEGGDPTNSNRLLSVISYHRLLEKKHKRRIKKKEKRAKRAKMRKNTIGEDFSSLMVEINKKGNSENTENMVNDDVICVSDESTSECVIIQDTEPHAEPVEMTVTEHNISTGFPKKYDGDNENSKKPESDDDIIYIPPPPVEVINIDVDDGRDKEQERTVVEEENHTDIELEETESRVPLELHDASDPSSFSYFSKPSPSKTFNHKEPNQLVCMLDSSVSNDFLENASIENTNKFNFSLHGSDFNSAPGDFVRPTNPVEFCETESSCSTNDLNRDFNNSVKTIVFQEVEFPRADIFSEKNLESFGSYITPKRNAKCSNNSGDITAKKLVVSSSSDSSSESDFESCNRLKTMKEIKKLPNLSPMQFTEAAVTKKKSKKKKASEFFKDTKRDLPKRKSDVMEISDSDSDTKVEKPIDTRKKQPKKKYKMAETEEATYVSKKKKGNMSEGPLESDKKKKTKNLDSNLDKVQTKKKKDLTVTIDSDSDESDAETNLHAVPRKKKDRCDEKKKKKHSIENVDHKNTSKEATTKNRKKKKNSECTQIPEPEVIEDTPVAEKAKKKKSISSENEDACVEKKMKKRRKSCSTSSNKSLEVSEVEEYIEVELCDEVNSEAIEFNKNGIDDLEAELYKLPEQKDSSPRANVVIEEKENIVDNEVCTIRHDNDNEAYGDNFATITEISDVNVEDNESDEEIIVDDDVVSNLSNIIVLDEVTSTTLDEQAIEVQILSSDSENVSKAGVEDHLALANCSSNAEQVNISGEIVEVDENSARKSPSTTTSYAMQRYCREFDVEAIQRTQTDDPEAWKISHKDRFAHERPRGPRCNRCRRIGHYALQCTEIRGPPKCALCGNLGHQEPRCTNKICTQCGNQGDYSTTYCWKCFKFRSSVCRICNMQGHIAKTCPDLWRRYHLTTEAGPIVVSQGPQLKPRNAQWCSGCAKRGHLEHECNYYNRAYPPTSPYIMNYNDVFYDHQSTPATIPSSQDTPTASYEAKSIPSLLSLNIPTISSDGAASCAVPPPMHLEIGVQPVSDHQDRVVVESGATYTIQLLSDAQTSNRGLNKSPVFVYPNIGSSKNPVLDKMKLTYLNEVQNDVQLGRLVDPQKVREGTKELCLNDQRRVKHIIMSTSCHRVREFLKREMSALDDVATQSDPKYLRKMFFKYDNLWKTKKPLRYEYLRELCFWNRIFNIFIFGVHKYKDGALHLDYLQSYLAEPKRSKLDIRKRRSLFSSYSYIFGVHRHNVSYRKLMNQIIASCENSQDRNKHAW